MSAPITEAHREAAVAIFAIAMKSAHHGAAFREPCAQLIADSEARACDQLRTEVEELKESILVQRIFSDYRQRAERAEAELAKLKLVGMNIQSALNVSDCPSTDDQAKNVRWLVAELAAERAIVSRIWVQLGSPTYAQLKGRAIYDLIDEMKAELAAERARLDWLEDKHPILWSLEDCTSGPCWLLTDFPGYTEETASQHKTARAAIDAAMKEDAK